MYIQKLSTGVSNRERSVCEVHVRYDHLQTRVHFSRSRMRTYFHEWESFNPLDNTVPFS